MHACMLLIASIASTLTHHYWSSVVSERCWPAYPGIRYCSALSCSCRAPECTWIRYGCLPGRCVAHNSRCERIASVSAGDEVSWLYSTAVLLSRVQGKVGPEQLLHFRFLFCFLLILAPKHCLMMTMTAAVACRQCFRSWGVLQRRAQPVGKQSGEKVWCSWEIFEGAFFVDESSYSLHRKVAKQNLSWKVRLFVERRLMIIIISVAGLALCSKYFLVLFSTLRVYWHLMLACWFL